MWNPFIGDGMADLSYYQTNGATSDCLQDAEREFLLAQGADPAHNQDMWFELLRTVGYTGAFSDMMHEFWDVDGGVVLVLNIDYDGLWGALYEAYHGAGYVQEWT